VLSPTSEILLDHNTTVSQFVGSKFLQICHLQLETKSHNTASERLHQRTVRLIQRLTDIFLRARLSQPELWTSQAGSSAKSRANLLSKYPLLKPKVRETVGKESNSSDSTIKVHFEIKLFENSFIDALGNETINWKILYKICPVSMKKLNDNCAAIDSLIAVYM